ncbi:hypothetical protein BGZ61DRAFT_486075 [Ilyonectria robusta]|uniref:uncharacterized protein n=1 Tax=Ilyonectria robusta TaxID=1079257 RepID=UPI001E8D4C36|nr:uncharacterized protein BGZ61DRAFT_486075 [Ilyonectria robusta]KAH8658887.1 hypothetical protein BGZ61DRAFT_486075 [Ilyonectria robusta]
MSKTLERASLKHHRPFTSATSRPPRGHRPLSTMAMHKCRPSSKDSLADMHPRGESTSLWGSDTKNGCTNEHVEPQDDETTMDTVRWLHLGQSTAAHSCREWLAPEIVDCEMWKPCWANWGSFLTSVRLSAKQAAEQRYMLKIPNLPDPLDISTSFSWYLAMEVLWAELGLNPRFWCHCPPPVILVCSAEQAVRCQANGWIDSVALEHTICSSQNETEIDNMELDIVEYASTEAGKAAQPIPPDQFEAMFGKGELEFAMYGNDQEALGDEFNEDETNHEVMVGGLGDKELGDDCRLWVEACKFFRHDIADKETGVRLPGLTKPSRNYQMLDAYKMLRVSDSITFNGTLNACKPGLGKTFEVLMTAAVIALAHLSRDHYKSNKDEHNARGPGVCALNHPFGIHCYCDPNSLTRQICQRTTRAPQLVVAPAGIVTQWISEAHDKLEHNVVFKSGNKVIQVLDQPLLLMGWAHGGTVHHSNKYIKARQPVHLSDFQAQLQVTGYLEEKTKYRRKILKERNKHLKKNEKPLEKIDDNELYSFTMKELSKLEGMTLKITYPSKLPTTDIGSERLVLVCSSNIISHGSFDTLFRQAIQVSEHKRGSPRTISVLRCFRPSAVYYDEWTEAKGKDTKMIQVLNDICSNDTHRQRPLVSLLSGTPMPRGPKDLVGVLPLISMEENVDQTLEELLAAYLAAYKSMGDMAGLMDPDSGLVNAWRESRNKHLSGCMFERYFGMPFLDGTVHDPRPQLLRYPEKYCKTDEQHATKLDDMKQALRKVIENSRKADGTIAISKLSKTREFQTMLRCSVMPGIAALPSDEWVKVERDFTAAANYARQHIASLACAQLTAVEQVVRQRHEGKVAHGLVMTMYPLNASIVASWLTHRMGDAVHVAEVTSTLKPDKRRKFVKALEEKALKNPNRPIVVVSTYTLLSTGIDGLQTFASYLVKLGAPWNNKYIEQAEGRIHRSGQKELVRMFSIHGDEGSLDWELSLKNNRNFKLLGKDGIISSMQGRRDDVPLFVERYLEHSVWRLINVIQFIFRGQIQSVELTSDDRPLPPSAATDPNLQKLSSLCNRSDEDMAPDTPSSHNTTASRLFQHTYAGFMLQSLGNPRAPAVSIVMYSAHLASPTYVHLTTSQVVSINRCDSEHQQIPASNPAIAWAEGNLQYPLSSTRFQLLLP